MLSFFDSKTMKLFKNIFGKSARPLHEEESPERGARVEQVERDADTLKFDALRASKMGQYSFALKAFAKALELRPEFETRYYLVETLMKIGAVHQALSHLNLLVDEVPEHVSTRIYRAQAFYREEQYDRAIEDLQKALSYTEDEKEMALLHRLLSANYSALGEWQMAISEANLVIEGHDEEPIASLYKMKSLVALQRWDEAISFLSEAVQNFPEEERFHLYEAEIFIARGDLETAERAYHVALEKDPFNEDACCGLARIAELSSDLPRAIELLQTSLEEGIVGKNILVLLIQLLEKTGLNADVESYRKQLEELNKVETQQNSDFEYIFDSSVYGDIFGSLAR